MPRNLSNESAGASSNAANNGPEGDVLLAGGVSAGSPQTFTGHNQFTEPVQVNTLNSALDIVVGRYLYTNNDILKEVDNEGIVSEVEYTNYKGCAKVNGGSLAQPQSFTGDNSFSGPLTVNDTRFQIKNNGTNVIFDVNSGDLTSNVIITPSGAANSGIEVRAVGNEGDPNQNKIILNDNVFLPPSADLTLGDLGSLRETLNAITPCLRHIKPTRTTRCRTLDPTQMRYYFTLGKPFGPAQHFRRRMLCYLTVTISAL